MKKLKKKDYLEAIKLIKSIKNKGVIQRHVNKFLKGDVEFTDIILDGIVEFAEVLGEKDISDKLDNLLEKTVPEIDLKEIDLDEYINLVIEWVEFQGLMGFMKKLFPSLEQEILNLK